MSEDRLERIERKLDALAGGVIARFDQVDLRLDHVDARFDQVDVRLDDVDARFDQVDARFDRVEKYLASIEKTPKRSLDRSRLGVLRGLCG